MTASCRNCKHAKAGPRYDDPSGWACHAKRVSGPRVTVSHVTGETRAEVTGLVLRCEDRNADGQCSDWTQGNLVRPGPPQAPPPRIRGGSDPGAPLGAAIPIMAALLAVAIFAIILLAGALETVP